MPARPDLEEERTIDLVLLSAEDGGQVLGHGGAGGGEALVGVVVPAGEDVDAVGRKKNKWTNGVARMVLAEKITNRPEWIEIGKANGRKHVLQKFVNIKKNN